jgi:hypothetical protein
MKKFNHYLKHWFVAHRKNDHRPHLIRRHGLALVAAVLVGIQGLSYLTAPVSAHHGNVLAYGSDINAATIFNLTNQQRLANGLPALHMDGRLNSSATYKAADMFTYNYWAHVSPSGVQPWFWFNQAGYSYSYAGENLAKDFDTSSGVMDGWMNSPGHRANILNPNYTDVGFAVENGTLVGGQTTLVVAHYGSQAGTRVAASVVPTPVQPKPVMRVAAPPAPILTPVASVTSTPSPVPSARPTPTPSPVIAFGSVMPAAPAPAVYRPIAPLAITRSLSSPTLATMAILIIVLMVYLQTHVIVWRKGLKRWRKLHYKMWAGGQISALMIILTILGTTGGGRVG